MALYLFIAALACVVAYFGAVLLMVYGPAELPFVQRAGNVCLPLAGAFMVAATAAACVGASTWAPYLVVGIGGAVLAFALLVALVMHDSGSDGIWKFIAGEACACCSVGAGIGALVRFWPR